jgi:hypothetical protein
MARFDDIPHPVPVGQRRAELEQDISAIQRTATDNWLVIASAVTAGVIGRYFGRRQAAFENTVIGGIYAGFSAYRDPRSSAWLQLLVAASQGAAWGLSDVYFPILLDAISGRAPEQQ